MNTTTESCTKTRKKDYINNFKANGLTWNNIKVPLSRISLIALESLGGEATTTQINEWLKGYNIVVDRRRLGDPVRDKLVFNPKKGLHKTTVEGKNWCAQFLERNNIQLVEPKATTDASPAQFPKPPLIPETTGTIQVQSNFDAIVQESPAVVEPAIQNPEHSTVVTAVSQETTIENPPSCETQAEKQTVGTIEPNTEQTESAEITLGSLGIDLILADKESVLNNLHSNQPFPCSKNEDSPKTSDTPTTANGNCIDLILADKESVLNSLKDSEAPCQVTTGKTEDPTELQKVLEQFNNVSLDIFGPSEKTAIADDLPSNSEIPNPIETVKTEAHPIPTGPGSNTSDTTITAFDAIQIDNYDNSTDIQPVDQSSETVAATSEAKTPAENKTSAEVSIALKTLEIDSEPKAVEKPITSSVSKVTIFEIHTPTFLIFFQKCASTLKTIKEVVTGGSNTKPDTSKEAHSWKNFVEEYAAKEISPEAQVQINKLRSEVEQKPKLNLNVKVKELYTCTSEQPKPKEETTVLCQKTLDLFNETRVNAGFTTLTLQEAIKQYHRPGGSMGHCFDPNKPDKGEATALKWGPRIHIQFVLCHIMTHGCKPDDKHELETRELAAH